MEKIAVSTDNGHVARHFGRCPEYTIVEVEGDEVVAKDVIDNPGHKPGFLPRYLREQGVDCVLAGGMGRKAVDLFNKNNIDVVTGVSGKVDEAVRDYLAGNLEGNANICDH